MAKPKSSANLKLSIGRWVTDLRLMRIRREADAPVPILTHSCRGEVAVVERCPKEHTHTRVTGVQNTGTAEGKPATEPKDKVCPVCTEVHEAYESAITCPTCKVDMTEADIVTRLSYNGRTVEVSKEALSKWKELLPGSGVMQAIALVPANTVGSVFRDEAYQLVPEKGTARGFALWLRYLESGKLGLIVRFLIKGNAYTGMMYAASIRGTSRLVLSTLYSEDEVAIEDFELPPVADDLLAKLSDLTRPLRQVRLDQALGDPQVSAFRALFDKGEADGLAQIRVISAVPFEDVALASAIDAELNPPKETKKKAAKKKAGEETADS